jgi:hypothetical protein
VAWFTPLLYIGQKPHQAFYFGGMGKSRQTLLALEFPGLSRQQMAVAGPFMLQATAAGALVAFGRTPMGFYFRHEVSSFSTVNLYKKPRLDGGIIKSKHKF